MMLNTKEFAAHWGVAPKTVRRWIDDELLEAAQAYPGGPYYISEEELYRFDPSYARRDPVRRLGLKKPGRGAPARSSSWVSNSEGLQRKSHPSPAPARTVKPWVGGKRNG